MSNGGGSDNKFSREYASQQDRNDPLNYIRKEFIIPSRADLSSKTLVTKSNDPSVESTYLCGNSLGLPPKCVSQYVNAQLDTWATKGVFGHFKPLEESCIPNWLQMDKDVAEQSARLVGALPSEVAVMQTLTANLHFLMASFYRPSKERFKIILEAKAFPSDHYLVESQIKHHNLAVEDAMILMEPPADIFPLLTTEHILSVIDTHASTTALLLLPGVQFYTGQFFDIKTITTHAQSKGITVGWDMAHAVGNVPLQLHDWNVDFAAWCNYKYMNCGPGAIGGLFVHKRHTDPSSTSNGSQNSHPNYQPRLAGWWGSSKSTRFAMTNEFSPIEGARGFQLSNPSALDISAVLASLSVFAKTDMQALRRKSLAVTRYLEELLDDGFGVEGSGSAPWSIITPRDPQQRGAQLSVKLDEGLLHPVMEHLESEGVVVDERQPDVVRIAPAPLYNSFEDARRFVEVFRLACKKSLNAASSGQGSAVMVDGGKNSNGWSEIL